MKKAMGDLGGVRSRLLATKRVEAALSVHEQRAVMELLFPAACVQDGYGEMDKEDFDLRLCALDVARAFMVATREERIALETMAKTARKAAHKRFVSELEGV